MGAVLVEEYPYAFVVANEHTVNVCANCMRSSKKPLSRCSRCCFVHYCNVRCQKEGWLEHKEECSSLVRVQPRVPTAMARLLSRVIRKRRPHNDNDSSQCIAFNGRQFDSLLSHTDQIKQDPEKSEFFITLSHVLGDYMGIGSLPDASELLSLFGKVIINVFTISNDDLNSIGLGLYLGLSALDHSCDPDAFVLFDGKKAILRALKHGTNAYDSNLRISYCDLLDLRSVRQAQLKQQFFFTCDCPICLDPQRDRVGRSVRCHHCEQDGYCPLDSSCDDSSCSSKLVCSNCGTTSDILVEDAIHLMQKVDWEIKRLQQQDVDSITYAKQLYAEASTILSPLNIPLCQLADRIVTWSINNENFVLAADYIERTIPCFKHFYPSFHPSLSLQYFKSGKLHSLSDLTLDIAAERLEQAVECLHWSHGDQHRLSVEAHELLSKVQQQRRDLKNRQRQLCD